MGWRDVWARIAGQLERKSNKNVSCYKSYGTCYICRRLKVEVFVSVSTGSHISLLALHLLALSRV